MARSSPDVNPYENGLMTSSEKRLCTKQLLSMVFSPFLSNIVPPTQLLEIGGLPKGRFSGSVGLGRDGRDGRDGSWVGVGLCDTLVH